eukprot:6196686-Pleurochrysis_carterae.AAC.1
MHPGDRGGSHLCDKLETRAGCVVRAERCSPGAGPRTHLPLLGFMRPREALLLLAHGTRRPQAIRLRERRLMCAVLSGARSAAVGLKRPTFAARRSEWATSESKSVCSRVRRE